MASGQCRPLRAGRRGLAPDRAGGAPRPPWRRAPRVLPGGLSEVTEQGLTPQVEAQFSRLARALGNPKRIELLELLGQAERSVEELATASAMDFANTSAQLQVLSRARLVEGRRQGRRVIYRLADDSVSRFLTALRALARDLYGQSLLSHLVRLPGCIRG